jgi:hypothetical protein
MTRRYLVRQYAPGFCSGFELDAVNSVEYHDILKVHWCERFKDKEFIGFYLEPYSGDELVFGAKYKDGTSWVVGFALPEDSKDIAPDGGLMRNNWRYRPHKS